MNISKRNFTVLALIFVGMFLALTIPSLVLFIPLLFYLLIVGYFRILTPLLLLNAQNDRSAHVPRAPPC